MTGFYAPDINTAHCLFFSFALKHISNSSSSSSICLLRLLYLLSKVFRLGFGHTLFSRTSLILHFLGHTLYTLYQWLWISLIISVILISDKYSILQEKFWKIIFLTRLVFRIYLFFVFSVFHYGSSIVKSSTVLYFSITFSLYLRAFSALFRVCVISLSLSM